MIEITKNKTELESLLNGSNIMIELIDKEYLDKIPKNCKSDLELLVFSSLFSKLYLEDIFCILDKSFEFEDNIQNVMFQEENEFEKSKTPSYKEIKYLIKKEIYDIKVIKVKELSNEILNEIKFIGEFKNWFNQICLESNYELNYEDNPFIILYYIKNLKNNIFRQG